MSMSQPKGGSQGETGSKPAAPLRHIVARRNNDREGEYREPLTDHRLRSSIADNGSLHSSMRITSGEARIAGRRCMVERTQERASWNPGGSTGAVGVFARIGSSIRVNPAASH